MNRKLAAALLGLLALAGSAMAVSPENFSAVDLLTSAPIDWRRLPSREDIQRYYPTDALQKRLEGRATISCAVNLSGRFEDCRAVSETPQGLGFGAAAARMAPMYKVHVKMAADGAQIPPATPVTFEVRFQPLPVAAP